MSETKTTTTLRAELRKRDDGLHGVIWVVDAEGNPVGDKQLEMGPMEDCLGTRMTWNLYLKELAKQPGFSNLTPLPKEPTRIPTNEYGT